MLVQLNKYVIVCISDGVSDVYMLKSVGDRMTPCGTSVLNWRCVDVCDAAFDIVAINMRMVCEMFVWCNLPNLKLC